MRIIHLSDLHFGTEVQALLDALINDVDKLKPDLIIVSGDLTQRARHEQFQDAMRAMHRFQQQKQLIVPGNHDISLYNLFERLFLTFNKYQKWVSKIPVSFENDRVSILGINSVTPYKPMGGYITQEQLDRVKDYFAHQPADNVKIIVMHHNLIRSERHHIINESEKIINVFAKANVNLVLSGHIHLARIEQLKRRFFHHNMYVITAGTAISTRTIEPNSYNVIDIFASHFELTVRFFEQGSFLQKSVKIYHL